MCRKYFENGSAIYMLTVVIANGLRISFFLVSDSENRSHISVNDEVALVRWLSEGLMAYLAHFSLKGKCLILVEGTGVSEVQRSQMRRLAGPDKMGSLRSEVFIWINIAKYLETCEKTSFSFKSGWKGQKLQEYFFDNVAGKQQNAALKFLMYLPTSVSENWTIIWIIFFSPSPNKFCMLHI